MYLLKFIILETRSAETLEHGCHQALDRNDQQEAPNIEEILQSGEFCFEVNFFYLILCFTEI